MRRSLQVSLSATLLAVAAPVPALATNYYVAPTGSDDAAGTEAAPFKSVTRAQTAATAGDTVFIRGGTYSITSGTNTCTSQTATVNAINLSKSGTAGSLIKYWAYPGETPVFDYSNLMADCRVKGFYVSGNYIHMKGITVTGVKQRNNQNHESWGVWVSGSNNVFELLDIYHIDGTGFFLSGGGANNLVLNCDSHHNFDPLTSNGACESGDGFGAHVSAAGTGNVFRGCRSWFNSDDDYDLINAFAAVTIENCWGWHAGYRYDTGAACGNGNGFKCGGYGTDTSTFPANPPVHVIRQNLSVGNRAAAFYANHHPGNIIFYNNTGYGSNPDFNMLGMSSAGADITVGTYRNNLAVGGSLTSNATSPNAANNSWTLSSLTANASDFQSTSETGLDGPRQADGSLPNLTNFHLAAGSDLIDKGVDVGLTYAGSAPDLGAFETGLSTGGTPGSGGASSSGGNTGSGGKASGGSTSTGGTTASSGGAKANGGSSAAGGTVSSGGKAAGGSSNASGGKAAGGSATGGNPSGGGSATSGGNTPAGGSLSGNSGGSVAVGGSGSSSGGQLAAGGLANNGGAVGSNVTSGGNSSTSPLGSGGASVFGNPEDGSGCGCTMPGKSPSRLGLGLLAAGMLILLRRRQR